MEETRVNKYKEYRNSFIKEDAIKLEEPSSATKKDEFATLNGTTSTLPIDEVIKKMDSDKQEVSFLNRKKTIRIIKLVCLIVGVAIVIAGLVVLGIFAFGGK